MSDKTSIRHTNRTGCGRVLRGLLMWFFLLFSLVFAGGTAAAGTKLLAGSVAPGSPFAIADFDGDHRPDLVSIQTDAHTSGSTNYSIQLELTTAGRQSIQLVGPAGGLVVEARDVNGDHAVDLVLATAWFRQPVAILLNDGHGGFSRAEPSAFPEVFTRTEKNWVSGEQLTKDDAGMTPRSGGGIWTDEKDSWRDRLPSGLTPSSSSGFLASLFLISHAGRAPPSEVHL